jgi:hypothetical protein
MAEPSKPWAMQPRPKTGTKTQDELYTAVGAALSTWELVEEGLAEIFATFIGVPEAGPASGHQPAIRAYGSVISFRSRQEMVGAAAQGFFHRAAKDDPTVKRFGSLMFEAGGFSGRRNEIAHGRVQLVPKKGFYLFPGLYNSSKNPIGQQAVYAYTASQLFSYREGFELLSEKLTDYAIFVAAWEPPRSSRGKPPRRDRER